MAALILPSRRVWQPQGPAGVDWSSPVTRGLVRLITFYGASAYDHVDKVFLAGNGTDGRQTRVNSKGFGVYRNSATLWWNAPIKTESVRSLSAGWVGNHTAIYTNPVFLRDNTSTGGSYPLARSGTTWTARVGGTTFSGTSGLFSENVDYSAVATVSTSATKVFANGSLVLSAGSGGTTGLVSPWYIGSNGPAGQGPDGTFNLFYLFDRPLTDAEAISLSNNPWQLFRPIQRRIMVAVSSGGTETSLTVAESSHGHTSDSLSLTTATALTAADSTHAHTADSLTLSTGTALVVAEASHAHAADALTLSTGTSLAVGDALHSHTADAPALTTNSALAVADASHGHTAENLTLSSATGDTLAVQDATHAHSAEGLTLTTAQHLAVADAAHGHTAEAPALSTQILLTVSDTSHTHSVENLTLSDVPALVIASVMHAHAADSVALTSQAWLQAQDALSAHRADNVSLSAFDADDELYPLAGLTQNWPINGAQNFPLAGQRQKFPLE